MSHDNTQVYRTTTERTGKMMIIMLGICIVGGGIFFSLWDYWISEPAPVVAMMAGKVDHKVGTQTGKTITQDLTFVESSDLRILGFNALPGEEGGNPTIQMSVGDKIAFNVDNGGIGVHAFGVTKNDEGFAGIVPGSEIGLATNPLTSGKGGSSEFIAGEEGTYYYICTVPGHREQGMVGEIIITPSDGSPAVAAAPTGVSHDLALDFVEAEDFSSYAFNALSGEEGNNPEIRVNSGDTVTVTVNNAGRSPHAFGVVSNPEDVNSIVMDSAIGSVSNSLAAGQSDSVTFTAGAPGNYYYVCTVPGHAFLGMQGNFIVE